MTNRCDHPQGDYPIDQEKNMRTLGGNASKYASKYEMQVSLRVIVLSNHCKQQTPKLHRIARNIPLLSHRSLTQTKTVFQFLHYDTFVKHKANFYAYGKYGICNERQHTFSLISARSQYPGMNQEGLRQACLQAVCNTSRISYCQV